MPAILITFMTYASGSEVNLQRDFICRDERGLICSLNCVHACAHVHVYAVD